MKQKQKEMKTDKVVTNTVTSMINNEGIIPQRTVVNTCKTICAERLELVPDDIPLALETQIFPVNNHGDGNCLPRCASLFMYGIEDHHSEIRRKIAKELEENSEYYLDDKSFEKGRNPNGRRAATSVFASFSDHYFAEKLNTDEIRNIFVLEVNEISKPKTWMGIWQISCLPNILYFPVVSVCLSHGTNNVKYDMHRVFYPRDERLHCRRPVHILWTNTNGPVHI